MADGEPRTGHGQARIACPLAMAQTSENSPHNREEQGMSTQTASVDLTPVEVHPGTWTEYRELWGRAEALELLTAHPLHLDLELTSHCNLRCKMCWQSGLLDTPMGFMEDELFERIVDEGVRQGLCGIKLQIRGESTMHPRLARLARYAHEAGVLDVQLTTNGTLLDKPGKLEELLGAGLHKLIFSIDPAHDESAREIYGDRVPEVRMIVQEAVELRNRLGLARPYIRVQAYTQPDQTQEELLAELKREFPDVDEYLATHLFNAQYDVDSLDGLSTEYEMYPCSYLWTRLAIYWNGDATICCRDYNATMKLGNVRDAGVRALWLGEKMGGIRLMHLRDERQDITVCSHCEVCTEPKLGRATSKFMHEVKA